MDDEQQSPELAAEALAAVTGILQDEPVTRDQGKLARALPREWKAAVDAFLTERKFRAFRMPRAGDHDDLLEQLTAGVDAQRRAALVSRLADPGLGQAYLEVVARATAWLRSRWPSLQLDTPIGPRALPPSRTERWRCASLMAVVDHPGRILDEMRAGTLTSEQAEAFRACYPALFGMLRQMIWTALALRYKTPERYALPYDRELVLRRLVGLRPDVSLAKVDQPPASPAPTPKVDVDFRSLRSKAQDLGDR
jgi:hypothetical protein